MSRGFTLVEILIVIGIIVILIGAVVIAVNPGRQFAQSRDATRWSHVDSVLNAVYANMADNNGNWTCAAGALPATSTVMASALGYDICNCLVPTYVAEMPIDPSTGSYTNCTNYDTDYAIIQDATSYRVTITATGELGAISMTR